MKRRETNGEKNGARRPNKRQVGRSKLLRRTHGQQRYGQVERAGRRNLK